MKVVHITTVHQPFDTRIFHKECTSLAQAGFDVSLIVTDNKEIKESVINKVKLHPIKKYNNRFLRFVLGSYHAYKVARTLNAAIYHIHDPELLMIGKLLKKKETIIIYDVHEDYETSIKQKPYLPRSIRLVLAKLFRLIERNLSKEMETCLAEKYYSRNFSNGLFLLNYPLIDKKQGFVKSENTGFNRNFELIYTGNVTEDRGAFHHANIINIHPEVSVQIVGSCSVELANKLAETANNSTRLEIEGIDTYVPRETIDARYTDRPKLAGLALFPYTEHYAEKELTKFFEYMKAGIPILCSDFPSWKEFVLKHRCGIAVNPNQPEQIKEAIDFLISNPEQAKAMGQNGQRAILEGLNWETEKDKLVQWYKGLLDPI